MLKRTICIENPCRLSIRNSQLVVYNKKSESEKQVPVEDIGALLLDNPQISLTQPVLQVLCENKTAVISCDIKHMPSGLMLPLDANHGQNETYRTQISITEPQKKNLWKQTVEYKIRNQENLLKKLGRKVPADFAYYRNNVASGDATNMESQAARLYWSLLFEDKKFRRGRDNPPPNNMLNYGYALLRAAVARALVASGLIPTLGIHHRNKYNAYALADDIMEPYRPFVDECVYSLAESGTAEEDLSSSTKQQLLQVLTADVTFKNTKRPLWVGTTFTTASLVKAYKKEVKKIQYPVLA